MAPSGAPVRKDARHVWCDNDRILLAMMKRLYEAAPVSQLFNQINRDTLRTEGFPNGQIPASRLAAQLAELKRTKATIWKTTMEMSPRNLRRQYARLKLSIEDAAEELRIQLHSRIDPMAQSHTLPAAASRQLHQPARDFTHPVPAPPLNSVPREARSEDWSDSDNERREPPKKKAKMQNENLIQSFTYCPSPEDRSSVLQRDLLRRRATPSEGSKSRTTIPTPTISAFQVVIPLTPPKSPRPTHLQSQEPEQSEFHTPEPDLDPLRNVRLSPKIMSSHDSGGFHSKRHPVLLFRAFEPSLEFTARRFAGGQQVPQPPSVKTAGFRSEVEPHLRIDTGYDSPFISLTQFPRYALKVVSRLSSARKFAVFVYNDLDEEGYKKYRMRPRLVPKICKELELDDLPGRYTGRGEFLVWGQIDSRPILTLDTRQSLELFGMLTSMAEDKTSLTEESGKQMYRFVKDVDAEYREILIRVLVLGFGIPGSEKDYHSPLWEAFADVLFEDNETEARQRAHSIFSFVIDLPTSPVAATSQNQVVDNDAYVSIDDVLYPDGGDDQATECFDDTVSGGEEMEDDDDDASKQAWNQEHTDARLASNSHEPNPTIVANGSSLATAELTSPNAFIHQLQEAANTSSDSESSFVHIMNCAARGSREREMIPERSSIPLSPCSSSSEAVLIDLTSEDDDDGAENSQIKPQQPKSATPPQAVTQVVQDEEDCVIISVTHRPLSIRSRSIAAQDAFTDTPTRLGGRGYGVADLRYAI